MVDQLKKHWQRYKFLGIFVAFLIVSIFALWPYFSSSKALTANVYATNCSGDWFGVDRIIGAPEVLANGAFEDFNTENSAFYKSGFQSIVCQKFDDSELKDSRKFISAKIGLSLAINEILVGNDQINNSLATSTSEEIIDQELEQNNTEETNVNQNQEPEPEAENKELAPENDGISEPNDSPTLEEIPQEPNNQEGNIIENNQIIPGSDQDVKEIKDERIILPVSEEKTSLPADDLTPIFLPPDAEIEVNSIPTSEVIDNQIDAILNIRHSLEDNNYQVETFSSCPASPALHGGYFYFDLPEVKSFDDLEKVKVSLEGLLGGDPRLISYLDSLWIEVTYEDEPKEIVLPTLTMDKNSWRSDEDPIIKINNLENDSIKTNFFKKSLVKKLGLSSNETNIKLSLVDPAFKEINLDLDKDFEIEGTNDVSQIKLLRPRSFRPGRYKLKFKIERNGKSAEVEYDFQWGVLAINTNKSIYTISRESAPEPISDNLRLDPRESASSSISENPRSNLRQSAGDEVAYIQMAALDDLGDTLCDANLRLSVLNEVSGQETIFTTSDATIEKSGKCLSNNVVDIPDYFVYYQVGTEGRYDLTLTNLDNGYEIKDYFQAEAGVLFEVERIGPTRIYPLANYQMTIRIKIGEDFKGLITEIIPASFKIVSVDMENSGQAIFSSLIENKQDNERIVNFLETKKTSWNEQKAEEKNISWQVDWLADQTYELKYEFDAPDISPYFYLLGPLEFIRVDPLLNPRESAVFAEQRQWQIASDAIVFIQTANGAGVGSASATFINGVTVNNMMIAVCSADVIGQLSISDFSTAIDQSALPFVSPAQAIFYKVVTVNDVSSATISCTSALPTAKVGLHIYEYRGLATSSSIDNTASQTGSDSDPSSGVVATSNANDLLMTGVVYVADVVGFSSWSNSFTERNDFKDILNSVSFGGADRVVSATSLLYSTTASRGAPVLGAWRGQIAAFKMTTGITVYGTIYSDEGITPLDCSLGGPPYPTITLKVNGLGSYSGPCITSQGTFAIPGVVINNLDDVVTAYIDGVTQKGVVVTKAADTTSDINLSIYQDRFIVRHEGATSINNTDLGQWDKDNDSDIHFTSNGGFLVVDNDTELHIWTGDTFSPGGTVTTGVRSCSDISAPGGDIHIDDSATFVAGGAISIGASWTADIGATFTHNNYGVTFTSTGTGCIIAANSQNFYNVIFNGSNGGWSFSDSNTIIANDLTMTAGTLSGTASIIVNGGDATGDGTINLTGGTFTLDGAGNFGGATAWIFYNLALGDGSGSTITTATGVGGVTVTNVLTIGANQTLDAGSKTWTLSGITGAPFVISIDGVFTASTSTFNYSGDNLVGNTTITAVTYNNLTVNNVLETYVLTGTTNLNGDLTISNGILDVAIANHDLNVKGSWTNNGTFTSGQGTVTFNGTSPGKNINPGSSAFSTLTFNGIGGGWTLLTNNLDVNAELNITKGTLIASALNINLAQSLTIASGGYFTKGSGIFTFDGNGSIPGVIVWSDANSTKQDMGIVVVDGINNFSIILGSSVKATKLTVGTDNTLNLGASGYALTLTGSGTGASKPLTINTDAMFTTGDSTVEYTGSSTTDVTLLSLIVTHSYYNLKINGVGPFSGEAGSLIIGNNLDVASGIFNLGGTTIVVNDVFISGTLDVILGQNYALTVSGSWTNIAGSFNARAGLVTFNSAGSETITTNSQLFYQLTFDGAGSWVLQDALDVNDNFSLNNGTLTQAANANINLGGDTIFALGITFVKASGAGKVIFDGTAKKFTDNTTVKQNLGNIEIGASPDDVTLCADSTMDSLTVNVGDIYYTNGWDINVTASIAISGTLDATDPALNGLCASEGNQTQINLGADWTVDSGATFTAGGSTVIFDEATTANLNSGGTDGNHDFNNLTILKSASATVALTNYNLKVSGSLNIGNSDSILDVSTSNYNINVGSNWSNAGTFTARAGTVTFDADSIGKTIDSGGTGSTKDFYNIVFNNSAGGWTIQTNNLTATNNFSIIDTAAASGFIVEADRTITVNGNFINGEGGTTTTWNSGTVLNLTKTGGGSYTINTKTTGADTYVTLQVGANTDIRMWNSSASTYTINASGSLYSMDHATTDGALYIWGDYHTTSGNTDYWNYAEDFDGVAGANRQVKVYLQIAGATNPSVTVDGSGILNVKGGGSIAGDITIVGQDAAALWDFDCTGTCKAQESTWNYLNLVGGTLTVYNTTLNNEDAPDAGTLNVDWYLGDEVVDRISLAAVDTADTDITISENSGTPVPTVFKWSGSDWTVGAVSQTTGTGADGKIPQPGVDRAIKIREYARTSAGYTFYKYNLYIAWQDSSYGEYDYYQGYGKNYITSTLNTGSGEDECISELWQRNDMDAQNNPTQAIDEPPTNGTWYNGMLSGLSFSIDDYTIDFGGLIPGGNPTDQTNIITVSTSASNGYVVYVWSTQIMTFDGNTISDWTGSNISPSVFGAGSYGFGYSTDDYSLIGGVADRFSGPKFAGFIHDGTGGEPVADRTGPSSGEANTITYRLAANATQAAGTYTTNIIYIVVPNY